jgi:hypothetical protein
MKKLFSITVISVLLTGCDKFLDVYPNDRLLENQILSNQINLHNVLNGIYGNMMAGTAYGAALTQTDIEIMAQRYDLNRHTEGSLSRSLQVYDYVQSSTMDRFAGIWSRAYTNIMEINYFIGLLGRVTVYIPENQMNILYGEAYGLRAMHHFDLLRLFGPVPELYATDSTSIMPYNDNTSQTAKIQPLISANEVMKKVIADLDTAARFLEGSDPIITNGIVKTIGINSIENFYVNRNHRMNYYAVKALQARVHLWGGNNEQAAAAARVVISEGGKYFPWVEYNDAIRNTDPDRIFSSEVIFGYRNREMYNNYRRLFAANVLNQTLLNPNSSRLDKVFDVGGDLRFIPSRTWQTTPDRPAERTSFKFAEPQGSHDGTFSYFQPLIRISEMYYILAEAEQDISHLAKVYNEARWMVPQLSLDAKLDEELAKEYAREFWGEGQLFFFYKRKNMSKIPNGNTENTELTMAPQIYKVPIPLKELEIR